jgi:glycerol kinase
MLPLIKSSSEVYCTINLLGEEIPVSGIAGDQQSALFGQGCFEKGDCKCTYGTGCFLLANTGKELLKSLCGLITTVTATVKGEPMGYALEGSVFVGGAVIGWLRDELRLISDSKDSEYYAKKVEDSGGVYIVPAFAGIGAPYWDMDARGTIVGITRGTKREHLIRAGVESIGYQTADVINAINCELSDNLKVVKVDGGASQNDFLMQFQADISNVEVTKAKSSEATAMGVAMLAGLAVNLFKSKSEILSKLVVSKTYKPQIDDEKRAELISGWQKAVRQTLCK